MCTVWRLHTNTESKSGKKIAQYCLDKGIAAMGWCLKDKDVEKDVKSKEQQEIVFQKREMIKTYSDYRCLIEEFGIYERNGKINTDNVKRLCEHLREDDLIWMRLEGKYYLGRYTAKSKWIYNCESEALDNDAGNQVTNIDWVEVGAESDVPGAVSTSMIGGQTFARINNDTKRGVNELSKLLYNNAKGYEHYKDVAVDKSVGAFYNVLSPIECEDLLCMWLFEKYGYVCIPSTNKKSTELYECVLVNPRDGRNVFPQVKAYNGGDLDAEEYRGLEGDVWLFVANGNVKNNGKYNNVFVASPEELFEFAKSDRAQKILPTTILKWIELFK